MTFIIIPNSIYFFFIVINIINKLMSIIFHLNLNQYCTFSFDANLLMIYKNDIIYNWFIKLHELVFISTHVVFYFIVKIPHVFRGWFLITFLLQDWYSFQLLRFDSSNPWYSDIYIFLIIIKFNFLLVKLGSRIATIEDLVLYPVY
jgi:hypothetical protein